MTTPWTTHHLPATAFEPPPDDEDDDGPWCWWPRDIWGHGLTVDDIRAMTTLTVSEDYL